MPISYIALGSNLGGREPNIKTAIYLLSQKADILARSHIYETPPEGYPNQGPFLNAAVKVQTAKTPYELLKDCIWIEDFLQRERTFRNGPRTIDLDILFYDSLVLNEQNLTIPHPRLHERAFVLIPLLDICPELKHPILNKTIKELSDELPVGYLVKHHCCPNPSSS